MLLYRDGRFYVEGASFLIPDGFHVETAPDCSYEKGILAWNPSRTCLYFWVLEENDLDAETELRQIEASEFVAYSEVTPIEVNGLQGYSLVYGGKRNQYYEARFDLGQGKQFEVSLEVHEGDIRKVIKSSEFQMVLDGVQAEQMRT